MMNHFLETFVGRSLEEKAGGRCHGGKGGKNVTVTVTSEDEFTHRNSRACSPIAVANAQESLFLGP
ncbi:hypothetical protein SESBI_31136 [Sesbania bispinosa]|nr:hypothetical protein SESBI_31136 [Sesbania bispinosa]